MKALIFAAGKGTRLKPFTDYSPKALAKVNGISLLERNIRYLQSHHINDFVINIHHFGEQIVSFLSEKENLGANIEISDEKEELLETGGGLVFAKRFLETEEDFLIMNVDILTKLNITELIHSHKKNKDLVTLAVSQRKSSRKLLFDSQMCLRGWKNTQTEEQKRMPSEDNLREFAFSGIHCVNSEILGKIKRRGKFSIMEEYLDLMFTESIRGFYHTETVIDVGRPESVLEAEQYFK